MMEIELSHACNPKRLPSAMQPELLPFDQVVQFSCIQTKNTQKSPTWIIQPEVVFQAMTTKKGCLVRDNQKRLS
ncbi:hypothetical protein Q31b_16660 [Novipirellula aureliae]|uniref:Uncharacterized protein n=1 Tax=Novipirellula aureliae TaxID=2527966 RepID=A0A5C6E5J8_9BACT|nr:hypothetical protein Q31b_16660 [Novipirellula aureliae]